MNRESITNYVNKTALVKGWIVNPDDGLTSAIIDGLERNYQREKKLFCPCREVPSPDSAYHRFLCPCEVSAQDILKYGQCYCGLFLAYGKNPAEVQSIEDSLQE